MKQTLLLLVLALLLTLPSQAAFVVKKPCATTIVTESLAARPTTASVATVTTANRETDAPPAGEPEKTYDVASFLFGLAGVATGIAAVALLATAGGWAVAFFVLTFLLGLMALKFALKNKKHMELRGWLAVAGFILGAIEAAPFTLVAALVLLFSSKKTSKRTN